MSIPNANILYITQDVDRQWPIVSQAPSIAPPPERKRAELLYLPLLVKAWEYVEKETGYRWKSTSYWRNSPSHHKGIALDIAPDIAQNSEQHYAVNNGSDPVLYKRTTLLRQLQNLCKHCDLPQEYSIGIFVEPDHLHLQVFNRSEMSTPFRLYKWRIVKPVYADSAERSRLPMINS